MTEIVVRETGEPDIGWVNASGEPDDLVRGPVDKATRELARWVEQTRGQRRPSLFDRTAYVSPESPYAQMNIARAAVANDDVVGGVCDITEGLMLQGVQWESPNADDTDVFNQINRDLNMDEFVRMWHREEFTYSQAIVGMWWGLREYTVRGVSEQKPDPEMGPDGLPMPVPASERKRYKRKKKYSIYCPLRLMLLDPMRVVPMPPGIFGFDRLAWIADSHEFDTYQSVLTGEVDADPVMRFFFDGPVTGLSRQQRDELAGWGIDPTKLIWLNPNAVVRSTNTRVSYERWPEMRMKSVFPILDLKQQLLESDRVSLVGTANYILLVKKGSEKHPAHPDELTNLRTGMNTLAKLPVIVGDHRLEIEIITPDQDMIVSADRYDTLDIRILNRLLGTFDAGSAQRGDSMSMMARAVSRRLEGRRRMLARVLEERIARAVIDHPINTGKFETEPNLAYTPRNVQLDADSAVMQALMTLRTQKEISRETILETFGLDQEVEAERRIEEEVRFDDTFQTQVPFSAPGLAPAEAGKAGGRPEGGGTTKKSPAKQLKAKTAKGNPSTKETR